MNEQERLILKQKHRADEEEARLRDLLAMATIFDPLFGNILVSDTRTYIDKLVRAVKIWDSERNEITE